MATTAKKPSTSGKNTTSRKSSKPTDKPSGTGGIEIIGSGRFPKVPLSAIRIAERPKDGEESSILFYNPRDLSSFTPDRMNALKRSVRGEGLIEPPLVRAKTGDGGAVIDVELIAGERRLRTIKSIAAEDLPCFDEDAPKPEAYKAGEVVVHKGNFGTVVSQDEGTVVVEFETDDGPNRVACKYDDVYPTVSGAQMYEYLECKVLYNCSDERALRLAFTENDQSEPLTIREEIALVERLIRMGKKQEEIAEILSTNVTWVSQTANFREQLPSEAFGKLMEGKMARHVAVSFLSHAPEDRQALYEATVKAEEWQTEERVAKLRSEQEKHEDEEDLHRHEAKKAKEQGDDQTAARETRKADSSAAKATKAKERRSRAESERGTIKQGHVKEAQTTTGISPKKGKMMDRQQVEDHLMKPYTRAASEDIEDPVTGQTIPCEMAAVARRVCANIIAGVTTDPYAVIREVMYDTGKWERPDDDEPQPKGRGGRSKASKSRTEDDDADEDGRELADFDFSKVGDDIELEGDGDFERVLAEEGLAEDDEDGGDFDSDKYDREWN